ncbi:pectate lyase, partial [Polaribacter sp. BAL334]|uniref:pectate lyase n=1 Tax=Polaribacter sp. BAL334 TaxID=1708178 RepID=UPI001A1AAB75
NKKEGPWFASEEAKNIAENVILYQRENGGWTKNNSLQKPLSINEREALKKLKSSNEGTTTDNGATYQEMLFLSKIYRFQPNEKYKESFLKGLHYLLEAQYENGGWPQFYPLKKGYYSHITFNDDSMANILFLLKEIKDKTNFYSIKPSEDVIQKVAIAFNKG